MIELQQVFARSAKLVELWFELREVFVAEGEIIRLCARCRATEKTIKPLVINVTFPADGFYRIRFADFGDVVRCFLKTSIETRAMFALLSQRFFPSADQRE